MAGPILLTRQTMANSAARLFREQYAHWRPESRTWNGETIAEVVAALEALGPTPSPDAVNSVIGRDWTTPLACDGCGTLAPAVVQVGQEEDYESSTATLCESCVRAALAAFEGAR